MKYEELRAAFKERPVFTLDDLHFTGSPGKHEFVQLSHWVKAGKVVHLRKGLYTLCDGDRKVVVNPLWLSNRMYEPSYISLEYALSYYGLIPEAVGTITCVSSRKPALFRNPFGEFRYSKIKQSCFFGFVTAASGQGLPFWIAMPEKAVLDFLYLRIPKLNDVSESLLLENYRFQNADQLNPSVFSEILGRFKAPGIQKAGNVFLKLLEKGMEP
ncbi:MAG: hypothetical protein V1913_11765 [Fibrobacterota bacterium]